MKGRAEIANIVGQDIATLPIIDLKLEAGCIVVTLQAEGPFNFPSTGFIRMFGDDGQEVISGNWDIGEGMEVPPRVFGTVVLPIRIMATV